MHYLNMDIITVFIFQPSIGHLYPSHLTNKNVKESFNVEPGQSLFMPGIQK